MQCLSVYIATVHSKPVFLFRSQVDSWNAGNHVGANKASRMTQNWAMAAFCTGIATYALIFILVIVLPIVLVAAAASATDDAN